MWPMPTIVPCHWLLPHLLPRSRHPLSDKKHLLGHPFCRFPPLTEDPSSPSPAACSDNLVLLTGGLHTRPSPQHLLGLPRLAPFLLSRHSLSPSFLAWRATHPTKPRNPFAGQHPLTLGSHFSYTILPSNSTPELPCAILEPSRSFLVRFQASEDSSQASPASSSPTPATPLQRRPSLPTSYKRYTPLSLACLRVREASRTSPLSS